MKYELAFLIIYKENLYSNTLSVFIFKINFRGTRTTDIFIVIYGSLTYLSLLTGDTIWVLSSFLTILASQEGIGHLIKNTVSYRKTGKRGRQLMAN